MAISLRGREGGGAAGRSPTGRCQGTSCPCFNEVPLTLPSTYPSGEHGAFRGGAPGPLLRLRVASRALLPSHLHAGPFPLSSQPRVFHLWLHSAPSRLRIHIRLFHPVSAPRSQKHTRPFQVKASRRTGSREHTGKEQQVWGCLRAQENFPGPHLWSPGSPRHPSASAHPESSALTSARRTGLTSLWCGAGDW